MEALAGLLGRIFSSDELRRAMLYHFRSVVDALPGPLASRGAVIDAVVRGMLLAGVAAADLRTWLVAARPRRIPEIDAALAVWAGT